ncbi:hypothetical protein [Geodermatophilus sabuli]|uniref:Uncharacterized protein n=1 Tax=Geodermatophilus sabuli TaxID=1564158 RepID=A0A285EEL9_9ACTN|nr:hypothetical protein [Geodermatophilus sabuli]MBB3084212.1 hypothetical protein [Geodermatophilus sabuli]SNX96516.1 hypothetical protein SAMN06893097_104231 [Geodermatophilus sabuli]
MKLNEMDLSTLAAVKAGLTRDHKDGTMLCDDAETIFFFTCEVAPDHWLYVELQTEPIISISTGIFRRPTDYMRRMIRAEYAGLRIHRDRQHLAGESGDFVDDLDADERAAHQAEMAEYWRRDDAIAEQYGPFHSIS